MKLSLRARSVERNAALCEMTIDAVVTNVQYAIVAYNTKLTGCPLAEHVARTERVHATCSIPGCWHLVAGRSWCNKHYQRWVKWGDPLKTLTLARP